MRRNFGLWKTPDTLKLKQLPRKPWNEGAGAGGWVTGGKSKNNAPRVGGVKEKLTVDLEWYHHCCGDW